MAVSLMNESAKDRSGLVRRGQVLEYLTLVSCSLEAVVSIVGGLIAGSVALVGFGADSLIEVTSGAALLWRLHHDAFLLEQHLRGDRFIRDRLRHSTSGWKIVKFRAQDFSGLATLIQVLTNT